MYGTESIGALAVTPGVTYAATGSIVATGLAFVAAGILLAAAARFRRRHDDRAARTGI